MGCCGQSRSRTDRANGRPAGPILFEYRGDGPLTMYGRMTGVRYHWPGPGARLQVDARDAPYLQVVRGLEIIQRHPQEFTADTSS